MSYRSDFDYGTDFDRERRHWSAPRGRARPGDRRRGRWRDQFTGRPSTTGRAAPYAPYEEEPYVGPGELGRYGDAPVPYGSRHTYNYHFGDRFGYGPDFYVGDDRVRRRRARREPVPPPVRTAAQRSARPSVGPREGRAADRPPARMRVRRTSRDRRPER